MGGGGHSRLKTQIPANTKQKRGFTPQKIFAFPHEKNHKFPAFTNTKKHTLTIDQKQLTTINNYDIISMLDTKNEVNMKKDKTKKEPIQEIELENTNQKSGNFNFKIHKFK